jgi:hypothetical protein
MSCVTLDGGVQGDDGDGQGCEGAGVAAGNPDYPGTLNQGQVNAQVNAQNPSDLEYWWTISTNEIPIYVPNDQPLSNNVRQILSQVYQNTWPISKPLCSGGAFVYAGVKEGKKGVLHGEALAVPLQVDSKSGLSSGVLVEGGVGPISVGGEGSYNWSNHSFHGDGLAFANKDLGGGTLGPVSVGLLGDTGGNVGIYAGFGVGVGVYGRPSFINGCSTR